MNKRSMLSFVAVVSLVTGVATAQTPPTPPSRAPRAPKVIVGPMVVPPVVVPSIVIPPIGPIIEDAMRSIEMAQPSLMALQNLDLSHLDMQLQGIGPALAAIPPMPPMPPMAPMPPMPPMLAFDFGVDHAFEHDMAMADREFARSERRSSQPRLLSEPPAPSGQQDVGDSLYQAARTALNRGNYESAARMFRNLRDRYQRSTYVGDSYYWEAYALYRQGGSADTYRQAVRALEDQKSKFPRAATRGDSDQLKVRLQGELARLGDENARRAVDSAARVTGSTSPCATRDDDDDVRITALNALMQMNSEDAMPVLRQVLAKRDACSAELRRKAVYVVSNKRTEQAEPLLLEVARNDPDRDVRSTAVSSLANLRTERSVVALDSIIRGSQDAELKQRAIAALAQHPSPRAGELLRAYVAQGDAPEELREYAIMYLASSRRSTQNSEFLRDQYKRTTSRRVKERIINSLASASSAENSQFLLTVAMDEQEPAETRRMALYQAAQSRMISFDSLGAMYDRAQNREMKETLLNIYSQRRGGDGVDKLIDIVKKEKDRELRNRAVQFLGQSRDPRAAQFLAQLINQ